MIANFVFVNFLITGAIFKQNPLLIPLGYFLVVDWTLRSWQVLILILAGLSLAIVFLVNNVGGKFDIATKLNDQRMLGSAERDFGLIERLVRARLVLSVILWLLIGMQAIFYFNSSRCWFSVPPSVDGWVDWLYGKSIPRSNCNT